MFLHREVIKLIDIVYNNREFVMDKKYKIETLYSSILLFNQTAISF